MAFNLSKLKFSIKLFSFSRSIEESGIEFFILSKSNNLLELFRLISLGRLLIFFLFPHILAWYSAFLGSEKIKKLLYLSILFLFKAVLMLTGRLSYKIQNVLISLAI